MRYTLFCSPGSGLKSSTHYVYLGEWLPYRSDIVILVHGTLTKNELAHILRNMGIPVFQSMSNAWIGLYESYRSRRYPDVTCVGVLYPITDRLFGGMLNVE